jgi:PAS domain S-box-containing protein
LKLREARLETLARPYRILSLEDSALDAELIQRQLEAANLRFDYHRVWTREEFETCLRDRSWDVILADHVLPAFDGDTALRLSREIVPDTPFIFVSGTLGEESAVEALRRGAKDYVVKQRLARLPMVVERAVSEAREHSLSIAVEDRLRDTQRRLEAVLDNASVSVFVMDDGQRCIYMNAAAEELTGFTWEEADGRVLHDLIHHTRPGGSHFPLEECAIDRAFPEDNRVRGEEVFVHKDGHFYPVAFTASPIRDEHQRTIGTVIEVRDISLERSAEQRRKAAEAELRQSEADLASERALLATLIEHLPAGVIVADREGIPLLTNPAYRELVPEGVLPSRLEHAELRWVGFDQHGKKVARDNFVGARALRGEFVPGAEFIHRAPDGRETWTRVSGVPLRGAEGEIVGALCVVVDIHAQKRVEARLRDLNETLEQRVAKRTAALSESQRRFEGIFNSALQFMALLLPDGTVLEVNQTALSWSEIEPSDIVGKPFWKAAPMRGNPALQTAIKHAVQRAAVGDTVRQEHQMLGAGDVRAAIDFSLKPIADDDGKPVFLVAEGRDITALKDAQEALRQSQKMEAMGQLTGGVAHDFNNLLTPIVGALDMLQRSGARNDRERRLLDGAVQSADRAKTLVQRLLAFARRQPLQATPVDIARLVEGIGDLVASTAGPQIKVSLDVDEAMPPANADPNQLEMALLNLCVNARDAMPHGGRLTLSADAERIEPEHRSQLSPGDYIRLAVADTGTGMDQATLARAVEPFFSTKGVGKGTGLGLSMVHGLASQLGGAMTIDSEVGAGTTIELWLPLSHGPATAIEEPTSAGPVGSMQGKVLLVEDEDAVRTSTADMLQELGFEIVEAASAEEAMRLLNSGLAPKLIITDHLMPGMHGSELADHVQSAHPDVRVLIISGYAELGGISPDLPRLAKPFRQSDLAAAISELLSAKV